jgi:protein-disulfide isomerase
MKKTSILLAALSVLSFSHIPVMAADSTVLAQVGPLTITNDQLAKDAAYQLSNYQAEMDLYNKKRSYLDRKTRDMAYDLAAKEAKLSVAEFKKHEIDDVIAPVTDQEIETLSKQYAQQAAAQGQLVSSPEFQAQIKKQATNSLTQQRKTQREQQVYAGILKKYPVVINLTPPVAPDIKIPYNADDPVEGPANARVTIIEYTDIQCPYCKRAQDTIRQVMAAYPKDVKLVSKAYPLPFHNRARPSAEAIFCAKDQGKYWEYREKAFASNPKLEDSDLSQIAKDLGLNMKKWDKCVQSHAYASRIDADIAAGQDVGVQGTPHFFVNNQVINGAQPFEAFKTVIDQELAKKP